MPEGWQEWGWIDFRKEGAEATMERDRLLFQMFKRGIETPVLRFYQWEGPALSFGRTQGLDEAGRAEAARKGWAVVRRPTGGGKVLHGTDLCFSLFWKKGTLHLPWKIADSYHAIHTWVMQSLQDLGIPCELLTRRRPDRGGWCFQSAVCFDLTLDGRKIVGGAQWRDGGAALHQGSIQAALEPKAVDVLRRNFEDCFNAAFVKDFTGAHPAAH